MSDQTGSWQPDPHGRHQYRYWDGGQWTDQVSNDGVVSSDPTGDAPAPAPEGESAGGAGDAGQPAGWGAPPPPDPTTSMPAASAGGSGTGTGPTPPPAAAGGEPPKKSSGNTPALIIGGVLLLILIGAGAWLLLGGDDDPSREDLIADFQEEADLEEETATCVVDELDDSIGLGRLSELAADESSATSEEESALEGAIGTCLFGTLDEDDEASDAGDDDEDTTDTTETEDGTDQPDDGDQAGGDIDLDDPLMEMFVQGMMEGSDLDEEQARCFSEGFLAIEGLDMQGLMEDPSTATGTEMMSAMMEIFEECDIDPEGFGGGTGGSGTGFLEGDTYGDNAELDALWDACEEGDGDACDQLYFQSDVGSEYEEFGDTCGGRREAGTVLCATQDLN